MVATLAYSELSERGRQILKAVVQDYIKTAEPVGSRKVAKRCGLGLSAATIRNAMADLEDLGLLCQPHTSAGRIPTEYGLRYYIDFLLDKEPLSWGEQVAIEKGLMDSSVDMSGILKRAVQILAKISGHAAIISAPRLRGEPIRHVEFVRVKAGLVLMICVLSSGLVQNRLISIEHDLDEQTLARLSSYLNAKLGSDGLDRARDGIVKDMEEDRRVFESLWEEIFSGRIEEADEGEIYIGGQVNLLDEPEFSNVDRMRALLRAFEEKELLLSLLDRCTGGQGIQIFIGSQGLDVGTIGCGLVLAPYLGPEEPIGSLGVVGPIRMNYARVMALVDYTAQVLSDRVNES